MVPREDLSNAVGLNSASFHAARMIGPGVAGLLIAWVGTGPVFLINAVTFLAVHRLADADAGRRADARPTARRAARASCARACATCARRPDLMLIMASSCLVGTFGLNFQITTALMATGVRQGRGRVRPARLGDGHRLAGRGAARRPARAPRLRLVIGAAVAFGVTAAVSALMPTYGLFALALIPVGPVVADPHDPANATVQLSVAPQMRGRVMALYMAVFMGGTPIGAPIIGWIGSELGARWTILFGGLVSHGHRAGGPGLRPAQAGPAGHLPAQPDPAPAAAPGHVAERELARERMLADQAADTRSAA